MACFVESIAFLGTHHALSINDQASDCQRQDENQRLKMHKASMQQTWQPAKNTEGRKKLARSKARV